MSLNKLWGVFDRIWMWGAIALLAAVAGDWSYHRIMQDALHPPVVEFEGSPEVVMKNGVVVITYYMRRNENCVTVVHTRWYNRDLSAFDVSLAKSREAVQAGVTDGFEPFTISMAAPPVGRWAYAPSVVPKSCKSTVTVYPPLALIEVK